MPSADGGSPGFPIGRCATVGNDKQNEGQRPDGGSPRFPSVAARPAGVMRGTKASGADAHALNSATTSKSFAIDRSHPTKALPSGA
jgi:hypothetical protein